MPSDWRSTMMAHSSIDPVWQAKVSSEVARNPELQEVIEQKCVTCHMPMATTQALAEGLPVAGLDGGFIALRIPTIPPLSMGFPARCAIRSLMKIWAPWKASVDIMSSILLPPRLTV